MFSTLNPSDSFFANLDIDCFKMNLSFDTELTDFCPTRVCCLYFFYEWHQHRNVYRCKGVEEVMNAQGSFWSLFIEIFQMP